MALTIKLYPEWSAMERETFGGAGHKAVMYEGSDFVAIVAPAENETPELKGLWDVTVYGGPDEDELRFLTPDKVTAETILEMIEGE